MIGFMLTMSLAACAPAKAPVTVGPVGCSAELQGGNVFSQEGVEGVFAVRGEASGCVPTAGQITNPIKRGLGWGKR